MPGRRNALSGLRRRRAWAPQRSERAEATPCLGAATLVFDLQDDGGRVDLAVHTVRGQLVRTLVRGSVERGRHTATWDGTDETGEPVAAGVYFIRLAVNGSTRTEKLLMMRDRG